MVSHESTAHPSRRTVVTGAAWSVPVIAAAVGASNAVASVACVTPVVASSTWAVPTGSISTGSLESGWTPLDASGSGTPPTGYAKTNHHGPWGTLGAGFQSEADNTSSSAQAVVTADFTFSVTSGSSYNLSIVGQVGWGNTTDIQSARQWVDVTASGAGSITPLQMAVAHPDDWVGAAGGHGQALDSTFTGYTLIAPHLHVDADDGPHGVVHRYRDAHLHLHVRGQGQSGGQ